MGYAATVLASLGRTRALMRTRTGIINTFTEHGFLEPAVNGWSHKDMQHTAMGVVWVAGGALGIFLARNGKVRIDISLRRCLA